MVNLQYFGQKSAEENGKKVFWNGIFDTYMIRQGHKGLRSEWVTQTTFFLKTGVVLGGEGY